MTPTLTRRSFLASAAPLAIVPAGLSMSLPASMTMPMSLPQPQPQPSSPTAYAVIITGPSNRYRRGGPRVAHTTNREHRAEQIAAWHRRHGRHAQVVAIEAAIGVAAEGGGA